MGRKNKENRKQGDESVFPKEGASILVNRQAAEVPTAETNSPPPKRKQVSAVADGASIKLRHVLVMFSFLMMVIFPSGAAWWYLYTHAADQYASNVGFSVRKEETGSAVELLGGISEISSGSSSDTDILYEFIQSQKMVELVDARLGLRKIYSKPDSDPVFAFDAEGSLEDLVTYWNKRVKIFYSGSNGLIQLRVHAFEATDARDITQAIFEESSLMINRLSAIAQKDATSYASAELDLAVERLKQARQAITAFRNETQIVDPEANLKGQVGLLNTLQRQLAEALIEQDLLLEVTQANDPRNTQAARRVAVIRDRIVQEREKFSASEDNGAEAYSTLIANYEELTVEVEFAEQFYLSALTTYNAARSEGQRQSRYLAAYVEPTLAQTPEYPQRLLLFGIVAFFSFLIWAIIILVAYSIKDRR